MWTQVITLPPRRDEYDQDMDELEAATLAALLLSIEQSYELGELAVCDYAGVGYSKVYSKYLNDYKDLLVNSGGTYIDGEFVPWLDTYNREQRERIWDAIMEQNPALVDDLFAKRVGHADMVVRNEGWRLFNDGIRIRGEMLGIDYYYLAPGPNPCPLCAPYVDRVYPVNRLPYWPPRHANCLTTDTKVLTKRGWVAIDEVTYDDKCLSINPDDFTQVDFVPVVATIKAEISETIEFKSRDFSLETTLDHQMLVRRRNHPDYTRPHSWVFLNAEDVPQEAQIYRSSEWVGNPDIQSISVAGYTFDAKLFAEFMGYFLSEGSVVTGRNSFTLSQCPNVHPDEHIKMLDCFRRMNLGNVSVSGVNMLCYNKTFQTYLTQFGKSFQKFVPDVIKNSNPELIRVFLDAYALGDGTIVKGQMYKGYQFSDSYSIHTSSKQMVADLCELMVKIGKRPSVRKVCEAGHVQMFRNGEYTINHDVFTVSMGNKKQSIVVSSNSKNSGGLRKSKKIYDSPVPVACVELSKWHTLYAMRDGKCCWTGNCYCRIIPTTNNEFLINPGV